MNRYLNSLSLYRTLFVLFLASCGTWVGNPKDPDGGSEAKGNSEVSIAFEGTNETALTQQTIDVYGTDNSVIGTLSLSQARLVLREIRLKSASNSQTEDTEKFTGPYIVNLINNVTTPDPSLIKIPDGTYSEIEMRLYKLDHEEVTSVPASDPLIDNSIHMTGIYTPIEGSVQPFYMIFDFDEEFKIPTNTGNGIEINPDAVNDITVAFDLSTWFDFSSSEHDFREISNGSIILNKDAEEAANKIRDVIKENIKDSADFYKEDQE